MQIPPFTYMRWTKRNASSCRLDLTASGVAPAEVPPLYPVADYRARPQGDGDAKNEALLAARYGVPAEETLFVPGTTMANFLLLFALIEKGDRVLVETPAYEALPGVVRLLGGEPVPLPRRPEEDFAVDLERVESAFADGIGVAFLTDLHNPTGVRLPLSVVEELRQAARRHGATVILDEVYRDFLPGPTGTAYRSGDRSILVTSSLTKVYGLGPLRAGWLFAPPDLRARAADLTDYLTVLPPAASARAAEYVLVRAEELRQTARGLAARGRNIFMNWAAQRDDVAFTPPDAGLVTFPAFEGISDTAPLVEWLKEERETLVVPGRFFEASDRVRISFLPEPEVLETGLAALGEGIEHFRE